MDNKKLVKIEIAGVLFTYFSGIFLKQASKIFDFNVWTIIFGAVNNSLWEEMKCFAFPYLIWACIEFCMIKPPLRIFTVSKSTGLYAIISLFIIQFAFSFVLFDNSFDLIKIMTELIWCIIAHYVSYKILTSGTDVNDIFILSIFMIILFLSMYLSFTVNPPHFKIFKDAQMQIYGIPMCSLCYNF